MGASGSSFIRRLDAAEAESRAFQITVGPLSSSSLFNSRKEVTQCLIVSNYGRMR